MIDGWPNAGRGGSFQVPRVTNDVSIGGVRAVVQQKVFGGELSTGSGE